MSRHQFRGGVRETIAELDIDISRLSGGGGADYPFLSWQLQLRLDVQLHVEEYGPIEAHTESKRPNLWGLRNVHRLTLQEQIEISQTHWIERVLPMVGWGKIHVIELPAVPIESCQSFDHSF